MTGGQKGDRIAPQKAMTGKSRAKNPAAERDRTVQGPLGRLEGPRELRAGNGAPKASVTGKECGCAASEFRWNHGLKEVRRSGQRVTLDRSEGERGAARRPKTSPSRREVERAVWPLRSMTDLFALRRKAWGVCAS